MPETSDQKGRDWIKVGEFNEFINMNLVTNVAVAKTVMRIYLCGRTQPNDYVTVNKEEPEWDLILGWLADHTRGGGGYHV